MDHPAIAILLAVYNPNEAWLTELLQSLDRQTYPTLRLYVRDDASTALSQEKLQALLERSITRFPFCITRNQTNLGSNKTFEALLRDCNEPYIAFCDQDDIWLPNKLENSYRLFRESPLSPTLVCTNVSVMDGNGAEIAPRMEAHRHRHIFLRGNGLSKDFIYRNFVMGCTVLMERERALSYCPFPDAVVHDHYLAYRSALDGSIDYLEEPQMRYRVYGGNQTGVMTKVNGKADYCEQRIFGFQRRVACFSRYADDAALRTAREFGDARLANFRRDKGAFRKLWSMRSVNPPLIWFELFALRLPAPLFRLTVRLIQKGIL